MKLIIVKFIILLNIESILSSENYRDQFSTVCGQPKTSGRIVGGTNAGLGEFPWMARIGYKSLNSMMRPTFFCGGSLITDRHILSASHCFYDVVARKKIHTLIVSLGDHDEQGKRSCVGKRCADRPVMYDVDSIQARNLDDTSFKGDIAIMTLKTQVNFTRWISPICLSEISPNTEWMGQNVITMGFGLVDSRKRRVARILQKITISIRPLQECAFFSQPPGIGQICAGHPKKDSCDGDSGGPLIKLVKDENGPKYVQLGVVSFGAELCENDKPAVYTDVNYYLEWIDDQLNLQLQEH